MGRRVYIRDKKVPGKPGHWPEKKKAEVVTTWLATGNLSLTSKLTNVPLVTCKLWKTQDWWKEAIGKLYEEDNLQLDAKLSKVLDKSIEAVNDRIENGEYMYDKKAGKLHRVPAKLKDLHVVTKDLIDKRRLIRKEPTQINASPEDTNQRLLKLAESFAAFVTGKPPEEKLVTGVYEGEFETIEQNSGQLGGE